MDVLKTKADHEIKCYDFKGYKQINKASLLYLEYQLQQERLMFFLVKTPENGRKNIFRDKKTTNKVLLMILNEMLKCLTNKKDTVYMFSVEKPRNKQ